MLPVIVSVYIFSRLLIIRYSAGSLGVHCEMPVLEGRIQVRSTLPLTMKLLSVLLNLDTKVLVDMECTAGVCHLQFGFV